MTKLSEILLRGILILQFPNGLKFGRRCSEPSAPSFDVVYGPKLRPQLKYLKNTVTANVKLNDIILTMK